MRCSGIATRQAHQPKLNDMKVILLQKVPGQWWSMPLEREIDTTDPAIAITLAWDLARRKGIEIRGFRMGLNNA